MPKNVMKLVKPSPNLGRNAFDMSFRNVFSAKFGELLPAYCQETVPNDSFEIRPADLIRALPLVTSPFLRAKQHLDFWFVPYNLLWSRFNEFIVDKDEVQSSASKDRKYCPNFSTNVLSNYLANNLANDKDVVGMSLKDGIFKIYNLLGYGDLKNNPPIYNGYSVYCNPFRALAYQYIWYKEYRQQYYDDGDSFGSTTISNLLSGDSDNPISMQFNVDYLSCDTVANSQFSAIQSAILFQKRYRLWKKDLFTGLLPSTQFGNVSLVDSGLSGSRVALQSYDSTATTLNTALSSDRRIQTTGGATTWNVLQATPASFDILALRKSEAIQKWRENALRAGNYIEDNFEAHYGSKPKSHLDTHPQFLGSFDAPINIGDVDATAQTGSGPNQSLGSIAGKGLSTLDGKTIKFSTNDFGVIVGMFSILPETEYNATGTDRLNCLIDREDFFIPEYENLGLEPVDYLNFYTLGSGQSPHIQGYAPRYWAYKQRLDKCYDSFINFVDYGGTPVQGPFRYWTAPKYDVVQFNYNMQSLATLYVNPHIFDVMFGVAADQSDQVLIDMYFDSTAVRSMSVSGMPSY